MLRVLSQHSTLAESAGPPSAATLAFLLRPDENRRMNGGGLTISIAACMPCAMTRSPSLLPLPPPSYCALLAGEFYFSAASADPKTGACGCDAPVADVLGLKVD